MKTRSLTLSLIAALGGSLACTPDAHAVVAYGTAGATYSEDFDTLANTGFENTWANDSTIDGWYIFSSQATSGASGRRTTVPDDVAPADWTAVDTYTAATNPAIRSRVYSLGDDGSSERALGAYTTANGNPFDNQINAGDNIYAVAIQNTTGTMLGDFTITYAGEQWQGHFNADVFDTLEFSYLIKSGFDGQMDIPTQNTNDPYTRVESLDFVGNSFPGFPPDQPLDGNATDNREVLSQTITGLTWADGDYLILRWLDNDVSGEDLGLAIDDVSFSATAVPEPASIAAFAALGLLGLRRRR